MNQEAVTTQAQTFGDDPTEVRETDHYVEEYVTPFVEKWDELIDWEKRAEGEGSFFINKLKECGAKKVLDVATGTGFHSVRLLKAGFDVTSVDGSAEMLTKAFENARHSGCILHTVHSDWRWLSRDIKERFDAVICLGNSFTHLFSERDRRKALAEFYAMLNHDGVLILDQRNYDAIVDCGFSCKHQYHYCGDSVTAEPEYVDEGLARFKYRFSDGSVYHLNMFPLRKKYLRGLMREVGFQHIDTYGDYQEEGHDKDPDFLTHVVEKVYQPGREGTRGRFNYSKPVSVAQQYYNSSDADNFYFTIWGGEDIHIGLYENDEDSIFIASRRTVERIASHLTLGPDHRVIDLGSGYGGAARYLAKTFGCHVTALNLSEVENQRNREMNKIQGIDHLIDVIDGSFEDAPLPDSTFDVVWSQDALLHSGDRKTVIEEVARLLKPGGSFIFTDPMMADDCPKQVLKPICDRIHLDSLGSPSFYRETTRRYGLEEVGFDEHTGQLTTHYKRILQETLRQEQILSGVVSQTYIDNMKVGLEHWVTGGRNSHLAWGIFHFRKR
ncbi:MAG: methyltransferase domain-containing protein [Desulfatitalea sp.]|nr:methyltransferase domain-containing protein [Desulfatitalea sp.]NNK01120.1 methyltransferase domain-containing protein [Desulfatitalea sp.]